MGGVDMTSVTLPARAQARRSWLVDVARVLLEHGMNPNHMNWHHVTLLHDMAQDGDIAKAPLLLDHGADINAIDEEYRSTPDPTETATLGAAVVRRNALHSVLVMPMSRCWSGESGPRWNSGSSGASCHRNRVEITDRLLKSGGES